MKYIRVTMVSGKYAYIFIQHIRAVYIDQAGKTRIDTGYDGEYAVQENPVKILNMITSALLE